MMFAADMQLFVLFWMMGADEWLATEDRRRVPCRCVLRDNRFPARQPRCDQDIIDTLDRYYVFRT